MPRIISLLITVVLSLCSLQAREPMRVLFIGNSYTYCNNLPAIVQSMADEKKVPMQVESYTEGAMSLRSFLNTPRHAKAARMLAEGDYDWVILQDQSQTPAYNPGDTMGAVERWCKLAAEQKTRVMLFLTWAHAHEMNGKVSLQSAMQDDTSLTYCRAAIANKATVAPVGEAWRRWYAKHPGKTLHTRDLSHPTAEGSYLAACVIYSMLTDTPANKLPARPGKNAPRINSSAARELQKIAAATIRNFSPAKYLKKHEEREASRPSPEDARQALSRGISIEQLSAKLGKPIASQKAGSQHTYQFRLRNKAELVAYCTPGGIVKKVSIANPGTGVDIIDLDKL